jgi:hypothetical protein
LTTSAKSKSPASDDVDDEKKSPVLKGLAIINEHAMLRGNTTEDDNEVCRWCKINHFWSIKLVPQAIYDQKTRCEVLMYFYCFKNFNPTLKLKLPCFQDICQPDDLHPKYLPRADLFSTLIEILSKTEGRTRQTAVNTLVEVASAASGKYFIPV